MADRTLQAVLDTAKAQGRRMELALQRARIRAAQALMPSDPDSVVAPAGHERYVLKTYLHRQTGVRLQLVDTQADDRPRNGLLPGLDEGGRLLPYAVVCLDHRSEPQYFATMPQATRGVRRARHWCAGCGESQAARHRASSHARKRARPMVRI